MDAAIALAMERPQWRLSLQAHKVAGLRSRCSGPQPAPTKKGPPADRATP